MGFLCIFCLVILSFAQGFYLFCHNNAVTFNSTEVFRICLFCSFFTLHKLSITADCLMSNRPLKKVYMALFLVMVEIKMLNNII